VPSHSQPPRALKFIVVGGFGAGKTTFVESVSENGLAGLSEEVMSDRSIGVDDTSGIDSKRTTTVVADIGRITFEQAGVRLYLFGFPGQQRFWPHWPFLAEGALGAIVLADTRRLVDCFPGIDFVEERRIPFLVAVNVFDGTLHRYTSAEIRASLEIDPHVPIVLCDARDARSVRDVLIDLYAHLAALSRMHVQAT